MSTIRPGMGVEFMYYSDFRRENIHVMRSVIFDVQGKTMILSQAKPTILRSGLGREILVTYLAKDEDGPARYGFIARITDLPAQYAIASGQRVAAIAIKRETAATPYNIRLHYRISLPSNSDVECLCKGEKVNLIDISLGGAKVSFKAKESPQPHDRFRIKISFPEDEFNLDAEVVRASLMQTSTSGELQIVSLKFLSVDRITEQSLGKQLLMIERQILAQKDITAA